MAKLKNKIQKKLTAKNNSAPAPAPAQPSAQTPAQNLPQSRVSFLGSLPPIPAVSVITPMYNSQRHIKSCVMSVLNQTFPDFELILVDDCSTDDTMKIVSELAAKDNRIRIIRLERNSGGASEPRNTGMRVSRGKYIAFLDSDDMYTKTALEELVTLAEQWQADVVHTEQVYFPENKVIDVTDDTKFTTFSKELGGFCDKPVLETANLAERIQLYYQCRYFGWVHNKLFRRDLLQEKNIQFPLLKTSEDIIFYFFVVCSAPRILRVPNIIYIYRENPDSITRKQVTVEESINALDQLMIEGTKAMDDFMSKIPFFVENPQFRQLPIDYIIQQHLIWTQRFYEKYSPAQLDGLIRQELKKYCGDYYAFFAYMYSAVHLYRMRIVNFEKQIAELKNGSATSETPAANR